MKLQPLDWIVIVSVVVVIVVVCLRLFANGDPNPLGIGLHGLDLLDGMESEEVT